MTFTAEHLTQIIAVACEQPEECGRPVTHWTPRELTDEVIKRGIVETISPRHVDRFLKGGISARTRASTGYTSKDKLEDPEQYEADVRRICETYAQTPRLHEQGTHVISTDEKTRAIESVSSTRLGPASWLNQVEIWFSILSRRALKPRLVCFLGGTEAATG